MPSYRPRGVDFGPKTRTDACKRCPAVRISTHTSHIHDTDTSSCSKYMGEEILQVSAQSEQYRYSRRLVMHRTHRVTAAIHTCLSGVPRGGGSIYTAAIGLKLRGSLPLQMYLEHDDNISVSWIRHVLAEIRYAPRGTACTRRRAFLDQNRHIATYNSASRGRTGTIWL